MKVMNAGAWVGIVGGIVGLLVGVGAVIATAGSTGYFVGAIMLAVFGGMGYLFYRLFFKPMINASRLQKTGLSGTAKILEVRDTGVTINNSPQVKLMLEVKNSFGQRYNAETKVLVSRLNMNAFMPGMEIPVKIDPTNEKNVVVDRTGSIHVSNTGQAPVAQRSPDELKAELEQMQKDNERILITGKPARAIIKKNTALGANVNGDNPYVELELEVLPDNAAAFAGIARGVVSQASLPKYQPGCTIYVKYDLYDSSKVAVDHS